MQRLSRIHLPQIFLLALNFFFPTSLSQQPPASFCGKIRIQKPFSPEDSMKPSLLNSMVICKSRKLYFRTSLGLFPISSIDYTSKLLTISHTCSSSLHFISPSLLSAGFPLPPQPNSLLLFNCSGNKNCSVSPLIHSNCSSFHACKSCSDLGKQEHQKSSSCFLLDDPGKVENGFDPNDLNCSHYSRVYRNASAEGFELGTRISFDIPDHVPNICDECRKPHGNCGVGLRCICHPKECSTFHHLSELYSLCFFSDHNMRDFFPLFSVAEDKVISIAVTMDPFGNILFSSLFFTVSMVLLV